MITAVVLAVPAMAQKVTFYRDVLPILQNRCQECHRQGQMAPMAFSTYQQTRPWAKAIRESVLSRKMPPWFADPCCGKFSNDRSLGSADIETLAKWAETGAAKGAVDYQYFVVPTGFRGDRWVQAVEALPSAPAVVHHAVVYIREPGSTW